MVKNNVQSKKESDSTSRKKRTISDAELRKIKEIDNIAQEKYAKESSFDLQDQSVHITDGDIDDSERSDHPSNLHHSREPRVETDDDRFSSDARFGSDDRFERQEEDILHTNQNSLLTAPPPRPGMVQRWVRVQTVGTDNTDSTNYHRQARAGWRPRSPESLPKEYSFAYNLTKTVSSDMGVINIAEMVLMEMPEKRAKILKKQGQALVRQRSRVLESEEVSKAQRGTNCRFSGGEEVEVQRGGRTVRVQND